MSKIEIADDSGNECYEFTVPIPFYIRVKLEDDTTRYRVSLIDDDGKNRGQYTGTTKHKYLELHVPLIKLPKLGKLRIVIEESLGGPDYNTKHQVSILYLEYKPEKAEDMVQEDYREEEKGIDTVDVLAESEFVDNKADNDHEKLTSDNQKEVELTKEELEYLHKREEILKENQELKSVDETEEKREELKLLSSTEHELKLLSELGKEEE